MGVTPAPRPFTKRTEVIAVIGKAGAGKSTFINGVLGRPKAPVNAGTEPCTEAITPYRHRNPAGGSDLVLLDTPGFDGYRPGGKELSSEEIISDLNARFSDMKNDGANLRQIIVLHNIADEATPNDLTPRVHRVFKEMTKDMALALVTTHWDEVGNEDGEELNEDEAREEEEGLFAPGAFLGTLRNSRKDMTAFRSGQSSDIPGYTSPADVIRQLISLDSQSDESSSSTSAASVAESEEEDPEDRQENDGKASANTVPKESLVVMPRKLYDFAASKEQQNPQVHTPASGQRILLDSNGTPPAKGVGPPVATDVGGEPLYIGSAVVGDSVYPCKLGAHLDQFCHFANGGKEVRHKGQYYLLPFVADQMEWVDASHGYIPYNREPVEGGNDGSGATLYHVLLRVDGIQVPGKSGRFLGGAFASFQGAEHFAKKGYKILCWKLAGNAKN